MKFKGTKGKWFVTALEDTFVKSKNGKTICKMPGVLYPNSLSNAQLIASAPIMLEALQNLENDNGQIPPHAWEMVQKAIKKAIG